MRRANARTYVQPHNRHVIKPFPTLQPVACIPYRSPHQRVSLSSKLFFSCGTTRCIVVFVVARARASRWAFYCHPGQPPRRTALQTAVNTVARLPHTQGVACLLYCARTHAFSQISANHAGQHVPFRNLAAFCHAIHLRHRVSP